MNPGPAPTLVDSWFTWPFVIGVVCVFLLVVVWGELFKARETLSQKRLDAVLEPLPPVVYDDLCAIEYCNRYASTPLPGPGHALFVCRVHAGLASEWTGPALPYNNEESA